MSILIKNVSIITMDGEKNIIDNGHIIIEGNKIQKIAPGEYEGPITGVKVINGLGCVALPGFINMHTHIPMTLLRGYGEGLSLMDWLNQKVWPFESKMTKEDVYIGTLLGIAEMIRCGTTTFVDMYYKLSEIANAATDLNMRAYLGNTILGDDYEKQIQKTIELRDRYKDNDLVNIMLAPHSPYTCSDEALTRAGEEARKENIPVHIHLCETRDEIDIVAKKANKTPFKYCDDLKLFDENSVIAAHGVHVTDEDIEIMKKHNISVVNNPQSNMKLASGVAPVVKYKNSGINVCIGTDGASSNNNLNLIEEMQTASYLQKLTNNDPLVMSPYETLEMATVNAAKALNMEDSLGKIKEGYLADIILIDMNKPHLTPNYNTCANIVFSAQGSDVKTVIINGKVVMKDYKLKLIDQTILRERVENCVNGILRKL